MRYFILFFYIPTKNLQYILLNTLLTKYYTLLLQQYHLERKTTTTAWLQITENTTIALHVTRNYKLLITRNYHTGKKKKCLLKGDLVALWLITEI